MSLYYGHDEQNGIIIPRSNDFRTVFTYAFLTTSDWRFPMDLLNGYPTPIPYVGKHITEDTSFTIIDHTFDKDGTISGLIVEYELVLFMKTGITFTYSVGNFDVSTNMLPFTTRNVSLVDKTYKFSDYRQDDWKDILMFYVKVRKVSGNTTGNESAITVSITF